LVAELSVICLIGFWDKGESYVIFFYCTIITVVLIRGAAKGFLILVISYAAHATELFIKNTSSPLWSTTLSSIYDILGFLGIYTAAIILRYVIQQNSELNRVSSEFRLKTIEQQQTYEKLLQANKQLEEMAIVKERNRIAREIHDTIGHRLTTAIVEMEAGKTIYQKHREEAFDKFILAQQQVKECLEDVRTSVRALTGYGTADFIKAIVTLIEDTKRHTGITIKYDIEEIDYPVEQEILNTLYRVVQEGLTNGIKHGQSTIFVLTVCRNGNNINLTLQDNGRGCSCVVKGFGLSAMESRVAEVRGTIKLESEEDEGFTIDVSIPINLKNIEQVLV
jgi:signal transduction histidine kinase